MRVLFDQQIFNGQKLGGISRYFKELYSHVNCIDNWEATLGVKYSDNVYLTDVNHIGSKKKYVPVKLYSAVNLFYCNRLIAKKDHNILHYTNYRIRALKETVAPKVVTVYDLIFQYYPEQYPSPKQFGERIKYACSHADKVLAISENTKRDLINHLKIPSEKIEVTYLDGGFKNKKDLQIDGIPEKYVLFVGARSGYKNFSTFAKAMAPIIKKDREIFVLCTGHPFSEKEKIFLSDLGIADNVTHKFAQESEFFSIYNHALAFVFPSRYEGFGIPVLEAMDSSCPVIISNSSSLAEIGGDAAMYFDPDSESEISASIRAVIYNEERRAQLIEKGHLRKKFFGWEKTAAQTVSVYEALLS